MRETRKGKSSRFQQKQESPEKILLNSVNEPMVRVLTLSREKGEIPLLKLD